MKADPEPSIPIFKRKAQKRTSWSRGVIGNKRPAKKGKIEVERLNSNASTSVNGNTSATENDSLTSLSNITDENLVNTNTIHPESDMPGPENVETNNHEANGTAANCSMDETIDELDESVVNESVLDESVMTEATDISKEPSLSGEVKKIVAIDIVHLEQLLNTLVQKTKNYPFVKLLRLHCKLVRTVDRFMKLWDRSSLILVGSQRLHKFKKKIFLFLFYYYYYYYYYL